MTTDLSTMNELDCLSVWAQAEAGTADPNANKLGHLRALAKSFTPSITNVQQMNALACLRSMVSISIVTDTAPMNELACLQLLYASNYSSPTDTDPARWNMLACLRGIVKNL